MSEGPRRQPPAPGAGTDSPFMSLISACLFLYIGFALGLEGISGNAVYDGSTTALVWGARFVGIGLLVVAALSYWRVRVAHLLDLALAGVAGAGCVVVGAIWLAFTDFYNGGLLLLFGLLNGSAARAAWRRWRRCRARAPAAEEP